MGKPRNTRKYPTYPEIPEIPGNTRKKKRYPEIPDRIFRHSYPTRTRPATRYFVQYPTRPDPILKNPTRWALPSSDSHTIPPPDFFTLHEALRWFNLILHRSSKCIQQGGVCKYDCLQFAPLLPPQLRSAIQFRFN